MSNHKASRATSVPNGMAVLLACAQTKRFKMKIVTKRRPGIRVPVMITLFCHSVPPKVL